MSGHSSTSLPPARQLTPGFQFGPWTILGKAPPTVHGNPRWSCRCVCGWEGPCIRPTIARSVLPTCFSPTHRKVRVGDIYDRWIVEGEGVQGPGGHLYSTCRCACGAVRDVQHAHLREKRSGSCGCVNNKYGLPRREIASLRGIRRGMIDRCYKSNATGFVNYGGRGIRVCDRWLESFENFYKDMGRRPTSTHSIERLDVNGDYGPGNCVWADKRTQANNRRRTRKLTVDGVTKPLSIWAEEIGISLPGLCVRLFRCGWDPKRAVTTPPIPRADKGRPRKRERIS